LRGASSMSVLRGLMRTVGAVVARVPAWEWFVLSKVCLLLQVTWMQVYHAPDERVTLEIAPVKSDVLPPGFPPTNEPLSPGTFRSPTGPGGDLQEEFASVPEFFPWQYESKTAAAWWAGHLAEKRSTLPAICILLLQPLCHCAVGADYQSDVTGDFSAGSSVITRCRTTLGAHETGGKIFRSFA